MIKRIIGRLRPKLTAENGETLVELMASILIGTLAIALLFGSVMAAGNIDLRTKQSDAEHYDALTAAERQQTALALTPPPQVQISNPGNSMIKKLDIDVYGDEGMYSYALKTNP